MDMDVKSERVRRRVMLVLAAVALWAAANAFTAAYVTRERYIYYWDWSLFWLNFEALGELFRTHVSSAIPAIFSSIRTEDYNVLPVVPLVPFELIFGAGRLPYILAITNMAVLPSAALMAWIAERTAGRRSASRFLLCTALLLAVHVLWAPALRGLPDAFGIILACLVLLTYFSGPRDHRALWLVRMGILLCLLMLTRRWYVFWAVSFFPAALLAHVLGSPAGGLRWKGLLAKAGDLALAGAVCTAFVLMLAAPLVVRAASTDYSAAYAAYGSDLAGGALAQILHHFGPALLVACALGLGSLVIRRESRELGIMLVAQAAISMALFLHVQSFLGVQHYYLLLPSAGIGLAGLVIALWEARWRLGFRALGLAALFATVLVSSAAVFLPAHSISGPLLPRVRYAPLVRPDLGEIDRLLGTLEALHPARVYVAASSEVLNWSILKTGCRASHGTLCPHIAVSQDLDARDGFPENVLGADYVVVATPTQYHVRAEDQQVIGLLARDVRGHKGIGSSFEPMPGEFRLKDGVQVQIYRRTAPLRDQDVEELRQELISRSPHLKRPSGRA